jgi:ribosomal protein S18 acetylase RimI-like enzyme
VTAVAIRPATPADVEAVAALVERSYALYVERLGRRPRPMDDDHGGHVARGDQHVLTDDGVIVGCVVLTPHADHLFVDNLAVEPGRQGAGLGRRLLDFAADHAHALGLDQLRLYTNAVMSENLAIYPRLGWERTGREVVGVYDRVSFRKRL